MIERFMKFYEACHLIKQSLTLELTNDKIADWVIIIHHGDSDITIFEGNHCSLNLLCAQAYIALAGWAFTCEELEDIENNL